MTLSRKQLLSLFSLILLTVGISAQELDVEITGQVFYHNSMDKFGKIKYVKNAKITTLHAKPTFSNSRGQFTLKFKGVNPDIPVFISVKKAGYEVVDEQNLQYFIKDKKSRLRVFLAEKGYVKKTRTALIASALKAHNEEKERLLDLLEFGGVAEKAAFKTIEKRTGRKLYTTHDAKAFIKEMSKEYLEHLSRYSYELAIINPDFASDTYFDAMNTYLQSDPEEAVAILQEEDLDKSFQEISGMIDEVKDNSDQVKEVIDSRFRRIDQIRNNYAFQVISLQQYFRFKEANEVMEKLAKVNAMAPTHKSNKLMQEMQAFDVIDVFESEEKLVVENKPEIEVKPSSIKEQWTKENETKESKIKESEKTELQSYSEPIAIDPSLIKKEAAVPSISELESLQKNNTITNVIPEEKQETNSIEIISDKGSNQNVNEMITNVEQIALEKKKKEVTKKDLSNKSLANASIDDFENILFFSNISAVEMISILEDEQEELMEKGEIKKMDTTTPKEVIKRDKLVKRPAPPAAVIIESTPEPAPQPKVIDKSDWLVFSDIPEPSFYSITKRTSLRKTPNPKAKILKRLAVGTEMEFIKRIDKYWYQVRLDGRIGYVKSYRLVKVR